MDICVMSSSGLLQNIYGEDSRVFMRTFSLLFAKCLQVSLLGHTVSASFNLKKSPNRSRVVMVVHISAGRVWGSSPDTSVPTLGTLNLCHSRHHRGWEGELTGDLSLHSPDGWSWAPSLGLLDSSMPPVVRYLFQVWTIFRAAFSLWIYSSSLHIIGTSYFKVYVLKIFTLNLWLTIIPLPVYQMRNFKFSWDLLYFFP